MTSKRGLCRRFYSLPENPNRAPRNKFSGACRKREDIAKLIKYVDDNVIGKNITFSGPYGRRKGEFYFSIYSRSLAKNR